MAGAAAGRKSRPPHLKLAEGRSPGRDSGGRVVPAPLPFLRVAPPKPPGMTEAASDMWDSIVADEVALRTMKALDAYALEALCEAYSRYREARVQRSQGSLLAETSQGVGVSPLIRIEAEASREFRSWCAEFGLTPAAEVKITSTKESAGDAADLF